jgi:hypothetical protein
MTEYSPIVQEVAGSIPAQDICVHDHISLYRMKVYKELINMEVSSSSSAY